MGMTGPKERATFSLDPHIKANLDRTIPKSERSRFVEQALDAALKIEAGRRFSDFLDELPTTSHGENSVDILHRIRREMQGRPASVLEGADSE
jgi:hypothetical protein